jgi:hypothetical protein
MQPPFLCGRLPLLEALLAIWWTQQSHLTCQKYKSGASQSHLKKGLSHHKLVTICQSEITVLTLVL